MRAPAAKLPPAGQADDRPQPKAPELSPASPPMTRLVIEEIGHTGRFIYKLLDPVSGEVVVQLPREEIVRLSELDNYAAGAVIRTEA